MSKSTPKTAAMMKWSKPALINHILDLDRTVRAAEELSRTYVPRLERAGMELQRERDGNHWRKLVEVYVQEIRTHEMKFGCTTLACDVLERVNLLRLEENQKGAQESPHIFADDEVTPQGIIVGDLKKPKRLFLLTRISNGLVRLRKSLRYKSRPLCKK